MAFTNIKWSKNFHDANARQLYAFGPKAKIYYLVLDAKLLLININYIEFFLFLEIL